MLLIAVSAKRRKLKPNISYSDDTTNPSVDVNREHNINNQFQFGITLDPFLMPFLPQVTPIDSKQ